MADIDPLEQLIVETRAFVDARPVPDFANVVMRQVEHLEIDRATTPPSWIARTEWRERSSARLQAAATPRSRIATARAAAAHPCITE